MRDALGEDLVGVYAGGSWALGDYLPGRSDLDVGVVVRQPLSAELEHAVVSKLRQEALACPARCLELVVYRLETARSERPTAEFELNLNTGEGMETVVQSKGHTEDLGSHWFAIDRSVLSQAGIALLGPPADRVFAPIPLAALAPVLTESVRWHRDHGTDASDAVLNACRALRFAAEELWSSKVRGGQWAAEDGLAPRELVASVLATRAGGAAVDPRAAEAFLIAAETRLRRGPT
jgi:hypothetical protein